jgi:hypothetical protein
MGGAAKTGPHPILAQLRRHWAEQLRSERVPADCQWASLLSPV